MTQSPYFPQTETRLAAAETNISTAQTDILKVADGSFDAVLAANVETSSTNAGAISITKLYSKITSAGAESRTLAAPSRVGQSKIIYFLTDGGDVTLALTNVWANEAKTATFNDVGDNLVLISADTTKWTLISSPGVSIA